MNKKEFPIILLRDIAEIIKTARLNKNLYSSVIDTEIVDFNITFKDKDESSNFYFSISDPIMQNGKPFYKVNFLPHHVTTVTLYSTTSETRTVWQHFENWLKILREYDSIDLSQDDEFIKQYQKEYFEEWQILDDDADEKPFNDQQQVAIFKLLEFVEAKLKEDENQDVELADIINETESLKANIQNFTKNAVVKAISKIFAKIKKKGLPLLFEILKEVKKEGIKRVITEGYDIALYLLHHSTQ